MPMKTVARRSSESARDHKVLSIEILPVSGRAVLIGINYKKTYQSHPGINAGFKPSTTPLVFALIEPVPTSDSG